MTKKIYKSDIAFPITSLRALSARFSKAKGPKSTRYSLACDHAAELLEHALKHNGLEVYETRLPPGVWASLGDISQFVHKLEYTEDVPE